MNDDTPIAGLFLQAAALRQAGNLEGARTIFLALLEQCPGHAPALHEIGQIALDERDLDLAEDYLRRACDAEPGNPAYQCSLGFLHMEKKRYWDAAGCFREVLRMDRRHERAHFGMALNFQTQGQFPEAERWWRQLISLSPDTSEAHINLAGVYRKLNRYDLAAREFATAAALLPGNSSRGIFARMMRALTLLATGDWAEGWTEYEARLSTTGLAQAVTFSAHAPRWNGEPDPGSRLLVYWEQGLGDTINFVRYLKYPIFDGMRVALHCQEPLKRLMEFSFGPAVRVVSGLVVPSCHWQTPIMSMPFTLLGRLGAAIPNEVPYLTADPDRVAYFQRRIEALAPGKRRMALAWQGNPKNPNDPKRSVPTGFIASLLELDAAFFLIQPDASPDELVKAGYGNVYSLVDDIADFADTAAAMMALDGVISVDTSVAHLAGALNRPTWLLLADPPDWRWGLLADKTVWYPSARLFRQPKEGDWPSALLALGADLAHWLALSPE